LIRASLPKEIDVEACLQRMELMPPGPTCHDRRA
jgi:hypothetical protein